MMSQNNSNETIAIQKARGIIEKINAVEEFDPTPLAVDYTDLKTGETMKRLPVIIQIAWFKLKYPESKIAVQVTKEKEYFVAKARIYANYKDPVDCYLSEASASRTYSEENPSVSPREWAQQSALHFAMPGSVCSFKLPVKSLIRLLRMNLNKLRQNRVILKTISQAQRVRVPRPIHHRTRKVSILLKNIRQN